MTCAWKPATSSFCALCGQPAEYAAAGHYRTRLVVAAPHGPSQHAPEAQCAEARLVCSG